MSISESTFNAFVHGSEEAFNEIYAEFKDRLFFYAFRHTRDRSVSEDVAVSTLIHIFQKRTNFVSLEHLETFAYKCISQAVASLVRKQRRASRAMSVDLVDLPISENFNPFEDQVDTVTDLIAYLPEGQARVFRLLLAGYSTTEIAQRLNVTKTRVYDNLDRGKKLLREYIKKGAPAKTAGPDQLSIGLHDGLLEVTPMCPDGSFIVSDDLYKTEAGIYVFRHSSWELILRELSALINKTGLKERELQEFFESYPELLLNEKYSRLIPQATIVKDDHCHWKADFVLVPYDQLSLAEILEIKLPSAPISRRQIGGHHHYSGHFLRSIRQLQDYQRAFDSPATRQIFKDKYQVDILKPKLQLMIGRHSHIVNRMDFLQLQNQHQVDVNNWNSVLEMLERRYR